jgi:hypothetical protein
LAAVLGYRPDGGLFRHRAALGEVPDRDDVGLLADRETTAVAAAGKAGSSQTWVNGHDHRRTKDAGP